MNSNVTRFIQRLAKVVFIFTLVFSVNAYSQSTLWLEDWEGNWVVDWHVDAGTWEVGAPTSGPDSAYNGQNCAATVLNGNYSEPVDSRLIRHTSYVVPSVSQNPRLRFWHWYSFSSGDYGEVQISTDGGSNWQSISTSYSNTSSGIWSYPFIDLSDYADSTVQIAFYFHSHQVGYYGNVSTGWYIDDVVIITGPVTFNNPDGFESGIGDWATERGTWEIGEPTAGPASAYSPPNCAGTVLSGNYAEPVDSRIISPPFVVPSIGLNPALQFWHWYSFSSGDYGEVQIRVEEGSWQPISGQFTNTSSGTWTPFYVSLTAYADSAVQIAFYFHSHQVGYYGNVSMGWYVDDINIVGYTSPVIYVSPGVIDFGDVQISSTKYDSVNVSNTGNDTLHLSSISFSGNNPTNFNTNTTLFNLAPGDSQIIAVSFTPDSVGNFSASLDINSDGGNISIGLTGNGTPSTGIENKEKKFPTEYSLQQNNPNPFNPATNIRFGLPNANRAKIEVYNMLGQRVAELLNENKPAGFYTVKFDGSNFASGVYFYKIQAGDFIQVKKMLLVR